MKNKQRNQMTGVTNENNVVGRTRDSAWGMPADVAGLDSEGWYKLALFEELSADCFNRPLLIALCERFAFEAKAKGYRGLLDYAMAKLSLQRSVIAGIPTLESSQLYLKLKYDAQRWHELLLEAIATAKLAAAISQAYVGAKNILYPLDNRREVEELLGCEIRDLPALSKYKMDRFAEALCLAIRGRGGTVVEAVESLNCLASLAPKEFVAEGRLESPMDPVTRAILGSAVGIANEYKIDLDYGYVLFCAALRIHPTFLAARLSAFHNRVAKCVRHGKFEGGVIDEMRVHLSVCIETIPQPGPNTFQFSERDADQVRQTDISSLWTYCRERKSAPIRAYAEFALQQVERFSAEMLDAQGLAETCASYVFPEIQSADGLTNSFRCAVENSWRAELHPVNVSATAA